MSSSGLLLYSEVANHVWSVRLRLTLSLSLFQLCLVTFADITEFVMSWKIRKLVVFRTWCNNAMSYGARGCGRRCNNYKKIWAGTSWYLWSFITPPVPWSYASSSVRNLVRVLRHECQEKLEITSSAHTDILCRVGFSDSRIQTRLVGNRFLKVWYK